MKIPQVPNSRSNSGMHSGFDIPAESRSILPAASMNQTLTLEQIHNIPFTQQLFLHQHLHHHHSYFPVDCEERVTSVGVDGDPDARHCCLKLPDCWQNRQDWELLTAEAYGNRETVERPESLIDSSNQKEDPTTCLESKCELEAMYIKRLGAAECNQTEILPVDPHLPTGLDHGSEASISQEAAISALWKHPKSEKKKNRASSHGQMIDPIAQFFDELAKQVMDHQENIHRKFTQVIERLDEERRERDEAWRNQELAHFQEEAVARAREKAMAATREATIISYLEKISGQRINLLLSESDQLAFKNTSEEYIFSSACMKNEHNIDS